ncbi:MAG: AAA family ATPase [Phycisphaerae bacterium]|jgi:MoxR-like ATPase|nr:AAA family ATPase [Phycisphaerae bacterium]
MPHKHLTIGERLKRDLDGTHSLVVIETDDEADLRDQLFMAVPENVAYHRWTAVQGLGDARFAAQAFADTEHPAAALAWITLKAPAARALWVFYDLCPHLSDARTLRALKEAVMRVRGVFGSIVLVERSATLPADLEPEVHRIRNPIPTEKELEHIVKAAVRDVGKTRKIQASIRRSTLNAIIRSLRGLSRRQASRVIALSAAEDDRFDDADLERVLLHKRNACSDLGGVLEFVQAPVSMDQIGGLGRLKAWLADRHMGMSDEASRYGLTPPRGMLLLGVQGAGKSLAAKAVATAWQVPLLRLDASALFDKFVGESERKLRESLAQADRMAPAVLWIDEIEKGFASASAVSSDGGLSRRMFGTLLTWMQERTAPTFLAATANDISALPPELLRKGRFDEVFFVDLPSPAVRKAILEIHLTRRKRSAAAFDLDALVAATDRFSGAEIEAGIEAAMRRAFGDGQREPTSSDFLDAYLSSPPIAVVMADRVNELRAWAAERCVPAE